MIGSSDLSAIVRNASGKRVVVLGDLHLDAFISGIMRGVSPEGPVPVLESCERRFCPGGAGNVAAGIAALGVTADVVSVTGGDPEAATLRTACQVAGVGLGGTVCVDSVSTSLRTRVTARGGHAPERTILEIVSSPLPPLSEQTQERLITALRVAAEQADAMVVVEGPAGICTSAVLQGAVDTARAHGILLVGDASGQAQFLTGYDVVLPNEQEAAALLGICAGSDQALEEVGRRLVTERRNGAAAITRGADGIALFTPQGREDVPTTPRDVFDVAGAGDAVTAAFTVALLGGADLRTAAEVANLAGYVAVGRPGIAVVTAEDLQHALAEVALMRTGVKLRTLAELQGIVAAARSRGQRIAFTNGCFDLLHPGHVTYLQQAAQVADALIVALNSDASVRALKGPTRPILSQDERAMILSALESVTWVTIFDERRVTGLLEALRPDVWVKGGDYTLETLDQEERAVVEGYGGEIVLIPPVEGISTTGIVERIEGARRQARAAMSQDT